VALKVLELFVARLRDLAALDLFDKPAQIFVVREPRGAAWHKVGRLEAARIFLEIVIDGKDRPQHERGVIAQLEVRGVLPFDQTIERDRRDRKKFRVAQPEVIPRYTIELGDCDSLAGRSAAGAGAFGLLPLSFGCGR